MTVFLSGLRPDPELAGLPDIVVGLGARSKASGADILALIFAALARAGLKPHDIAFCVTHAEKLDHAGLRAAAQTLGVPLLAAEDRAFAQWVPNPSATVERLIGRASVAEAAALAFGPLLAEKSRSATATCALSQLRAPYWPNSASAASTLSTSSAGP